jgi:hypothetical protein
VVTILRPNLASERELLQVRGAKWMGGETDKAEIHKNIRPLT